MKLIARLLTILAVCCVALRAQTSTIITLIPYKDATTGAPIATGAIALGDLSNSPIYLRAPNVLTSPYSFILPDTNVTGCLYNTASGFEAYTSFASCGMGNPMTTQGDIIYGAASGVATRLAAALTNPSLLWYDNVNHQPKWLQILGGGPMNFTNGLITISQATTSQDGYLSSTDWNTFNSKLTNPLTTQGDVLYGGSSGTPTRLGAPFANPSFLWYDNVNQQPKWLQFLGGGPINFTNGIISCPTCMTNPLTTQGDVLYGGSSGTPTRLGAPFANPSFLWYDNVNQQPKWLQFLGGGPIGFSNGIISCSTCVTSVSGSGPISSSGGTTPTISCSTCMTNPLTTQGDILYGGSSGTPTRLGAPFANPSFLWYDNVNSQPKWLQFLGGGPIGFANGIISCSTCVTTAGGQTIGGALTVGGLLSVTGANIQVDSAQTYSVAGGYFGQNYTGGISVGTSTLFFKSGILYACTGTC